MVCVRGSLRRTVDGPQSAQWWSLSHESQWIPKDKLHENGGHWVECVHSAAAGISSIGATYIPNVYLCFYTTSCECCVQTFLLRLIFIGVEPREKKILFFLVQHARARALNQHTHTRGNDDGFSSKLSTGWSNVYLFITGHKNKTKSKRMRVTKIIIPQQDRSSKMSRRIND